MNRAIVYLVVVTVCLSVLMSAGPTLIALAVALVPLIVAVGLMVAVVRLVWHYTSRG